MCNLEVNWGYNLINIALKCGNDFVSSVWREAIKFDYTPLRSRGLTKAGMNVWGANLNKLLKFLCPDVILRCFIASSALVLQYLQYLSNELCMIVWEDWFHTPDSHLYTIYSAKITFVTKLNCKIWNAYNPPNWTQDKHSNHWEKLNRSLSV